MDKTNKTTVWKWMVSEHARRRRKRNNLASDANEEKQSSDDNMQERENNLPTERSANNFHELSSTELQSQSSVQGILSQFSTFAGYEITEIYTGERIKKGARVIKQQNKPSTSSASTNRIPLGSIHSVSKNGTQINVQWDNSVKPESFSVVKDQFDLLLFDNAQTGVKHTHSTCNACNKHPLSGIRWKCLNCDDIDLCTFCYMCDAHEVSHSFNRIESEDAKGENMQPREDIQWTGYKYVCGMLEDAEVSKRNNKEMKGHVVQIYDYARGREDLCDLSLKNNVKEKNHDKDNPTLVTKDDIVVQWYTDYTKSLHNVLELKCEIPASHQCYPGHLPRLEYDSRGYLDVQYSDGRIKKKISVDIWYRIQTRKIDSYKPILYLIFENDNGDEKMNDKKRFSVMNEVFEFSRNTKLPCHVVGQRIMFHHGSSNAVFIHHTTRDSTIKELVNKGCLVLQRGDTDDNESEVDYFIRMAEYVLGVDVLPVMVSLSKFGFNVEFNSISTSRLWIPSLQFKKKSLEISILTSDQNNSKITEYKTSLNTPWNAKQTVSGENTAYIENQDKISGINDVQSKFDFEALICYVVIGVAVVTEDETYKDILELYTNALSMYLLKNGKWRIPKECINESFDDQSLEYIYEQDCSGNFTCGLSIDLEDYRRSSNLSPHDLGKGNVMTDAEYKHVLYGLIFFSLLKKEFYTGAKQLVETGFVRIHYILVGCQILQQVANDWKTTHIKKKYLTRLKEAFTHRAIQITRCIYETEKKKEDQISKEKNEKELGEPVGHAGRLLLNHGYLEGAITTENKTFIDNDTVRRIQSKMWYGEEELSWRQVFCFILLTCLHLIVMPFLMISMEIGPLKWFYKKYKLPFMKVITQMFGYFVLLVLYAYMLLFDLQEYSTFTDFLIMGWMASFVISEGTQAYVSMIRMRFKDYIKDHWNQLDWILLLLYIAAIFFKWKQDQPYHDASKICFVVTFILFSIRILHMFSMSRFLGPKLVIIHKMFKDTFIFLIILTVIMLSYNISFHSLLYPNSEFNWKEIEKILQNGYWMLFGEVNLDSETLKEPECSSNKTMYTSGFVPRCPSTLGLHVSPYLKAVYGLIAVILLLNLLIAIYSDTFEKVQQESEFHWSKLRTGFLEELSVKTIFPIHLQLLEIPAFFVHFIIWSVSYFIVKIKTSNKVHHGIVDKILIDVDRLDGTPMFIRVFLYNTNFDLRLQTTRAAEENGAAKSKGLIEVMEDDTIKILEKQMEVQISRLEKQHQEMLEELKNIKKYMKKSKVLEEL